MTARSAPSRRSQGSRPPARRRGLRLPARTGLVLWVVMLGFVAFLYAQPLSSYVDTRSQLAKRQAEVVGLRAEKERLVVRLAQTTSVDALARDARLIGRVRPGEQLFIVKGVDAWRKRHAASR